MRIKDIYIDGFGLYNNFKIQNLSPHVNVIFGLNEAGKSTLLAFQQRVLFGYADRRSRLNLYPPLSGGKHGGRLVIVDENDQDYTFERYVEEKNAKVVGQDGVLLGYDAISALSGNVDENVFNNIFAFGLKELQDFESLDSDEIKSRIYSAGTGTGSISIPNIIKVLKNENESLFKSQGSKPEINRIFKALNQLNGELHEIKKDPDEFDRLHDDLSIINEKVSLLEEERKKIRSRLRHKENLNGIWSEWRTKVESEKQLNNLPYFESFPENGLTRLDLFLEKIKESEQNLSELDESIRKLELERKNISVDEALVACREDILNLQKSQDKYASFVNDRILIKGKLVQEKNNLLESLSSIGPYWDEKKLETFDVSVPVKEKIREKEKDFEEISSSVRTAQNEIRNIELDLKDAEKAELEIDEKIKKSQISVSADSLKRSRDTLSRIRVKIAHFKEKESKFVVAMDREEMLSQMSARQTSVLSQIVQLMVLVFTLCGGTYLTYLMFQKSQMAGSGTLAGIAILGLIFFIYKKKTSSKARERSQQLSNEKQASEQRIPNIADLQHELEKLRSKLLEDAKICGFNSIPEISEIELRDQENQAEYEILRNKQELERKKEELNQRIQSLHSRDKIAKEEIAEWNAKKEKMESEWSHWLSNLGLDPQLSPKGALDVFSLIQTARPKRLNVVDFERRINGMTRFCEEYEQEIRMVMKKCGRSIDKDGFEYHLEIERLADDLKEALEVKNQYQKIEDETANLESAKKKEKTKWVIAQKDLNSLIKRGQADSEEKFRNNAVTWDKRKKLETIINQSELNIKRVCSEGEKYEEFMNDLQSTDPEELSAEIEDLETELHEKKDEIGKLREDIGAKTERIEKMERREESSLLRMQFNLKLEQLRKKADSWVMSTLAMAVLGKAVEKYERERQPAVIKEAQSFFSRMTLGRYKRFYAPLGENQIYVESSDDVSRKEIGELSRGTSEQLYLSLRFGLIKEFCSRSVPLPVIFDDVLVNFDPDRGAAACTALEELSETNQVIYFTCHPETLKMIKDSIPKARTMEL